MKKICLIWLLAFVQFGADAATVLVRMTRFNTFDPQDITINLGDTVVWTNTVSVQHDTVAFDGTWQSSLLNRGQVFSFTFTKSGTFDYFCTPHLSIGMVGSVTVQGGAANNPPTATITAPANGASFQAGDTINVAVAATDDSGVSKVELLVDGTVTQTSTAAPYQFSLNLSAGSHSLTARATDAGGLTGTSAPITVNVAGANQPPSVGITSPANNSTFTAPAILSIEATATDDTGIDHVEFFVNGASIGSDNIAPYSIAQTFSAGTYRLTATAVDVSGLSANSAEITVQVNEPTASAPTVSIISPRQDAYVEFSTNIVLAAEATDADGSIARVEFSAGTNALGVATVTGVANRFELSTPLPEGRVSITARATDNQGNTADSAPVLFTVAMRPMFTSRTLLTNGIVRLSVFGTSGVSFVFDYTDDMVTWTPFLTNVLYRRILFFDDETASGSANRMYRARSPDANLVSSAASTRDPAKKEP